MIHDTCVNLYSRCILSDYTAAGETGRGNGGDDAAFKVGSEDSEDSGDVGEDAAKTSRGGTASIPGTHYAQMARKAVAAVLHQKASKSSFQVFTDYSTSQFQY
jgi:hypothetical protein